MESPRRLSQEPWLKSQLVRRDVDRGSTNEGDGYYEDDDGHCYPSTTTIIDRIDFSTYPRDSELYQNNIPPHKQKKHTQNWRVKSWYKRCLGILAHYAITSQMDISTPDDRTQAREELTQASDDLIDDYSVQDLFATLGEYEEIATAAEGWRYDRYPADFPIYDVAREDAENIAHLWRRDIRPQLNINYKDVICGEIKFIRLFDGDDWPPIGYGGQIDLIAKLENKLRAVDLKTGNLRMSHRMQATAYQHALDEIEGAALIRVTPNGDWGVEFSEEWPQQSLWDQFRSEVILSMCEVTDDSK